MGNIDPNAVAAVVAAVAAVAAAAAALAALPSTRRAAIATREQAEASREQTRLQLELAKSAAQPFVWADVQPDNRQGTLLQIVVKNEGPTVARNVMVTITPPLPKDTSYAERIATAERRLESGLRSLAPGRSVEWSLGPAYDLMRERGTGDFFHTLRLTADGPYGPVEPLEFEISLEEWREARDAPDGSIHMLTKGVDDVAKVLREVRDAALRIASERE